MPDGIYERDAFAWSRQQGDLLQRLAAGEGVNAAVDWVHVIEEVRDVGRSELRSVRSLLVQAMTHLIKLHCFPDSPYAEHWRIETAAFLADAESTYTRSMSPRIALSKLYGSILRRQDDRSPPLPPTCPFTITDLLTKPMKVDLLVAKLRQSPGEITGPAPP